MSRNQRHCNLDPTNGRRCIELATRHPIAHIIHDTKHVFKFVLTISILDKRLILSKLFPISPMFVMFYLLLEVLKI